MSDRMDAVLASIDTALDGADDDWTVSGDAMRWAPPEHGELEDEPFEYSISAYFSRLTEALGEAARAIAEPFEQITRELAASLERTKTTVFHNNTINMTPSEAFKQHVCDTIATAKWATAEDTGSEEWRTWMENTADVYRRLDTWQRWVQTPPTYIWEDTDSWTLDTTDPRSTP